MRVMCINDNFKVRGIIKPPSKPKMLEVCIVKGLNPDGFYLLEKYSEPLIFGIRFGWNPEKFVPIEEEGEQKNKINAEEINANW